MIFRVPVYFVILLFCVSLAEARKWGIEFCALSLSLFLFLSSPEKGQWIGGRLEFERFRARFKTDGISLFKEIKLKKNRACHDE